MTYTPDAIANFFIGLPAAQSSLTPMKIQKLVYFAHGWHLALKDAPLLNESIQAWEFGPVVERLYHALKEHGDSPVTEPIVRLKVRPGMISSNGIEEYAPSLEDEPESKTFTKALLEKVWAIYGKFNAIQLSKMTHDEGTPWDQIRKQFPTFLLKGVPIPNEVIRLYFKAKLPVQSAT